MLPSRISLGQEVKKGLINSDLTGMLKRLSRYNLISNDIQLDVQTENLG